MMVRSFAVLLVILCCSVTHDTARAQKIVGVESRTAHLGGLKLERGATLPDLVLAYETYGTLAPDKRNAILLSHGYLESHHAAGRYRAGGAPKGLNSASVGWWDGLIGPGKAIDTDRWFVISANMLGSSFGSSGPTTSRGPFPHVTIGDVVEAQRKLVEHLGIERLVAVGGPSYGGLVGFAWGTRYPRAMDGVIAVATSPTTGETIERHDQLRMILGLGVTHRFSDSAMVPTTGKRLFCTLASIQYGSTEYFRQKYPGDLLRQREALAADARPCIETIDSRSIVTLHRALVDVDLTPRLGQIEAKVLYVVADGDAVFPNTSSIVPRQKLAAAGVDVTYFKIKTEIGHGAPSLEPQKWQGVMRRFLAGLGR
jgi:homoserine O-acetyltransferase/O-succinyltransferase